MSKLQPPAARQEKALLMRNEACAPAIHSAI
jgi:hypothetical protein